MSDLDYVKVNVHQEFPTLWQEYLNGEKSNIIGIDKFNNFLKKKNINAFAKPGYWIGQAEIRHDHYVWLKLKYQ
jgi:hypothetical protein